MWNYRTCTCCVPSHGEQSLFYLRITFRQAEEKVQFGAHRKLRSCRGGGVYQVHLHSMKSRSEKLRLTAWSGSTNSSKQKTRRPTEESFDIIQTLCCAFLVFLHWHVHRGWPETSHSKPTWMYRIQEAQNGHRPLASYGSSTPCWPLTADSCWGVQVWWYFLVTLIQTVNSRRRATPGVVVRRAPAASSQHGGTYA